MSYDSVPFFREFFDEFFLRPFLILGSGSVGLIIILKTDAGLG